MRKSLSFMLIVLSLATGCKSTTTTTQNIDSGTEDSGAADAGAVSIHDAATDASSHGHTNFANALEVDIATTPQVSGVIAYAGETDYYKFAANEGQFIDFTTVANITGDPYGLDTIIELFDSNHTPLASNDDSTPASGRDSELISRIPATGTYYISVSDYNAWTGRGTSRGSQTFAYELNLAFIDPTTPGALIDPEMGNGASSAVPVIYAPFGDGILGGTFVNASDVDVFSISVTSDGKNFGAQLLAKGTPSNVAPDADGSSSNPTSIWITDTAGTTTIAKLDLSTWTDFNPQLPQGDYLLWMNAPATTSTNDFYVYKVVQSSENPAETMDSTNGTLGTAEMPTWSPALPAASSHAYVLAQLPDGDTDYFAVPGLVANQHVSVTCDGQCVGSGVRGLTVDLVDSLGNTIATATENTAAGAPFGAVISPTTITTAGNYYVRITKTSQASDVTSTFARCGFAVSTPAAM